MAEETYETTPYEEIQDKLVLNVLRQEQYEGIPEERLAGELSNQLFMTDGDYQATEEVEGIPGQVVYCGESGLGPDAIVQRKGYVCEDEADRDDSFDFESFQEGEETAQMVSVFDSPEATSLSGRVYPNTGWNARIRCNLGFQGSGFGIVYGSYGLNPDYGYPTGTGFFVSCDGTNLSVGLASQSQNSVAMVGEMSSLTAGTSVEVEVVRNGMDLTGTFLTGETALISLTCSVPGSDPAKDVGYMCNAETANASCWNPMTVFMSGGTLYRYDPVSDNWVELTGTTPVQEGFLPGRIYRNPSTKKCFFLWDGTATPLIDVTMATLEKELSTKMDISASPNFRGMISAWNPSYLSVVGNYDVDDRGSRVPTKNDFIVIWEASAYNLNGYGSGGDKGVLSGEYRFMYNSDSWDESNISGWVPQYRVNEGPFSDEQMAAINSGIDSETLSVFINAKHNLDNFVVGGNQPGEQLYFLIRDSIGD